jgi:hypothetical protein
MLGVLLLGVATPAVAQEQVANVAAFARLYGVARWFYPSDAAATLDWNRFAVEGVRRVRSARTPTELGGVLRELFAPLGPGIEIGATLSPARPAGPRDPALVAWHYRGAGISANGGDTYSAKRVNRPTPSRTPPGATPAILSQFLPADSLRGRTVRLRAQVRAHQQGQEGWAGLWLRVDRAGGGRGFFDNMQDRPVRDTTWREYVIEGPIAPDATQIAFGALGVGAVTFDVDAVELATRSGTGPWTVIDLADASFEAPASGGGRGWSQGGPSTFARLAADAVDGARFMRISLQAAPALPLAMPMDSLETAVAGAAADIDLARGLRARVPLSLTSADASIRSPALVDLHTALTRLGPTERHDDADVRLADVVVAWNLFRHFSPYWGDVAIDWDARLQPQLEAAVTAPATRGAHRDAVRQVVADLRDGHGNVVDLMAPQPWRLPVIFRVLDGRLVVTASRDASLPVGSVVVSIGGTAAATRVGDESRLSSGTPQWRAARAAMLLQLCRLDTAVVVTAALPDGGQRSVSLPCERSTLPAIEARPDSIVELRPGIWYVDLTRIHEAALRPALASLSAAKGLIVDMRGYPTDAGIAILPHLMRTPEDAADRWMHVARIDRPFGAFAAWEGMSWNLTPAIPRIGGERLFLTDARAISYAESVLGYVRDYKLGTIIGATTAGANGDVATFVVPGGFALTFTGLRVTRHDGRTPFHNAGVSPDIPLEPTLAGIRAGRDELLERALAIMQGGR